MPQDPTVSAPDQANRDEHRHTTNYFVNGESQTTSERDLPVREILENAGFTLATDYTLKSENPPRDYDSEYDEEVRIHPNQRFQALFKGPTPVS